MSKCLPLFLLCLTLLPGMQERLVFQDDNRKKNGAEPGYQEQYLRMKRNEEGVIPAGVARRIMAQQTAFKTNSTNLVNVQFVGPTNVGGRTRALIIDHTDPNHFVAGGVSGGIWHSYDKGQSWQPVNDQAATLSVTCLDQSAVDPDIMYFGTGEPVSNSAGIPGDGLYKSTDGGQTFYHLAASPVPYFDDIWSVKASMTDANTVYVGTADGGLYRSTDGGASFEVVLQVGTRNVEDIEVFPDGKVMATINGNGIFMSATGNPGTFANIGNALPSGTYYRVELAYCDSFPDVMYASFENSSRDGLLGVWKSTDGGANWTKKWNDALSSTYYFPWYALMLGVKPDDPDVVVSGCVWGDFSTDGGNTWQDLKLSHADNHVIRFDPDNTDIFYTGNDGGVYEYDINTAGSTFQRRNTGYAVTQFYAGAFFPTGDDLFAGSQDNGTLSPHNGSNTFHTADPYNGDGTFTQINQQDPNVGYISWQYGRIRRTDEATIKWPDNYRVYNELDADNSGGIDEGAWFNNPFEMNRNDGDQIFYVTYDRLWRTNNGAANWEKVTNDVSQSSGDSPYGIGISNEVNPTVYFGGERGLFYRVDNARTANPGSEANLTATVPAEVTNSFIGCVTVHPGDPATVYVTFSNFSTAPRIYKVTNGTTSPVWTNISGDLPQELPVNWIEVDPANPDSFLIAATDFGLYTTVDGGTTWTREMSIPNVSVHQVRLRHSDRKLYIFTHGRGVWTADLMDLTTGLDGADELVGEIRVFPNPTINSLRFKVEGLTFDRLAAYDLRLYDIYGKLVMEKNNFQINSLSNLQINHLPSGAYFLKLTAPDGRTYYCQKVIKQ